MDRYDERATRNFIAKKKCNKNKQRPFVLDCVAIQTNDMQIDSMIAQNTSRQTENRKKNLISKPAEFRARQFIFCSFVPIADRLHHNFSENLIEWKTNEEKLQCLPFNLILWQIFNVMVCIVLPLMTANDVYLAYNNLPLNWPTTGSKPIYLDCADGVPANLNHLSLRSKKKAPSEREWNKNSLLKESIFV